LGDFVKSLFSGRSAAARRAARAAKILQSPDRKLMAEAYLPALARAGGRILWVGCAQYTVGYYVILEAEGAQVWTLDFDPAAAAWGYEARHLTGDVRKVDQLFAGMMFDAVICNGVLGYGVNSVDQQRAAFKAMAAVLSPGGRLLLGWNTDKIDDPVAAGLAAEWFAPGTFAGPPARVDVAGVTHVYDSLIRLG
jgi:SAM-dependent methyltransferase